MEPLENNNYKRLTNNYKNAKTRKKASRKNYMEQKAKYSNLPPVTPKKNNKTKKNNNNDIRKILFQ